MVDLSGHKIGVFTSVIGMGGSEVLIADTIEALSNAGADVICWSDENAAIRSILADRLLTGIENRTWPPKKKSEVSKQTDEKRRFLLGTNLKKLVLSFIPVYVKKYLGFNSNCKFFGSEIISSGIEMLFVNVNGSEFASIAAHNVGVKVVNCYHLSFTESLGGWIESALDFFKRKITMHSSDLTIHTSNQARDEWCRELNYSTELTHVIYNGVDDVDTLDVGFIRHELGIHNDDLVFCVPGRLDPIKGHDILLDAINMHKKELVNVHFLICGDGEIKEDLEKTVVKMDLVNVVRFLGWRKDLKSILGASNCVILPSLRSENLSVAVLEGLMCGTPAIVSRVGGMAEAIIDDFNGFVVPPGNADELGNVIMNVFRSPHVLKNMRDRTKSDAVVRFSKTRMMQEYVDIIKNKLDIS